MYKTKLYQRFLLQILIVSLGITNVSYADKPHDAAALNNINEGKVVWDVTVGNPNKLLVVLNVIKQTYDDLKNQNVSPEMVFAFRGPVLRLLSSESEIPLDQEQAREQVIAVLQELSQKPGVKMESCSIASRLMGINNESYISEVEPVGNTFVSLIGYQKQGYALIPIY